MVNFNSEVPRKIIPISFFKKNVDAKDEKF